MNEVKVGQVFKNYKDLCNHLGETVKGGSTNKSNYQSCSWYKNS